MRYYAYCEDLGYGLDGPFDARFEAEEHVTALKKLGYQGHTEVITENVAQWLIPELGVTKPAVAIEHNRRCLEDRCRA